MEKHITFVDNAEQRVQDQSIVFTNISLKMIKYGKSCISNEITIY